MKAFRKFSVMVSVLFVLSPVAVVAQGQQGGQQSQGQQQKRQADRAMNQDQTMDQRRLQDRNRTKTQEQQQVHAQQQAQPKQAGIYGGNLMTAQERSRYRAELGKLATEQQRNEYTERHREQMQQRARELGVRAEVTTD